MCHSAHVEDSGQGMRVILSPSATWVPRIQLRVTSLGSKSVQFTEPSPQPPVSFTSRSLIANIFHFAMSSFKRGRMWHI